MGFRFFKRMNILPWVTLNLSKGGGSVSIGPQGAKLTLGTSGARATFGIPGTGLFYTTNFSLKKLGTLFGGAPPTEEQETLDTPAQRESRSPPTETADAAKRTTPMRAAQDKFTLDLSAQVIPADDEKDLAAGCRALTAGNTEAALTHFTRAADLADGAFLAGVLALQKGRIPEAIHYLTAAAGQEKELGQHLSRYGITATLSVEITEEVAAHVGPNLRGVLLALAEAYQMQEKYSQALCCLQQLHLLEPENVVVKLSLAELLMEAETPTPETCERVLDLAENIENESAVHAALLLYKAKALRELGLFTAAQTVLMSVLKKKKNRPADLLRALRYERALVYEGQRETIKARNELEKLYADAPDYEDVKIRLGL